MFFFIFLFIIILRIFYLLPRGVFASLLIRMQLAFPNNSFLGENYQFNMIVSMHGIIMLFFVIVPISLSFLLLLISLFFYFFKRSDFTVNSFIKKKHRIFYCHKKFYAIAYRDDKRHEVILKKTMLDEFFNVSDFDSSINFLDSKYFYNILSEEEKQELIDITLRVRLQQDINSIVDGDKEDFFVVQDETYSSSEYDHYLFYINNLNVNAPNTFTCSVTIVDVVKCFVIYKNIKYYCYIVLFLEGHNINRHLVNETAAIRTYNCEAPLTGYLIIPPFHTVFNLTEKDYNRIIHKMSYLFRNPSVKKAVSLKKVAPLFYEHYYINDRENCIQDPRLKKQLLDEGYPFNIY